MSNKSDRIRELNDAFRTSLAGGRVVLTRGFTALPAVIRVQAIAEVKSFDAFSIDNDPHAEYDFGLIKIGNVTIYWKVDYYDPECVWGSEDPSDPEQTTRVLTIMLNSDY